MKKSKKNLFSSRIKKLSENVRKNAKNFTEQDSEYSQYSDALKDATKKFLLASNVLLKKLKIT